MSDFRIEPLAKHHDRASFSCGVEALDSYLKTRANQDMRRKSNAVFVLTRESQPGRILGYHTLCAYTLPPGDIPEPARKHLPRYPLVSATLIGCLAVSRECQGQGLGALLLVHGLRRAYESASIVGSSMVVVDAIDEKAAQFYARCGFIRLPESPRLVLPMRSIGPLLTQ